MSIPEPFGLVGGSLAFGKLLGVAKLTKYVLQFIGNDLSLFFGKSGGQRIGRLCKPRRSFVPVLS
ncbi:hypothetical protein ES703_47914 [subsurface metagenome]